MTVVLKVFLIEVIIRFQFRTVKRALIIYKTSCMEMISYFSQKEIPLK